MSNFQKSLNDIAWEKLFEKYSILNQIEQNGLYEISSDRIKEFREPRLMAKFDHSVNLPAIFKRNRLAILPITRGNYAISHFDAYHPFESDHTPVSRVSLPAYIQSLNPDSIPSESIALNCASAAGILSDFLQEENLTPTVSGRMGSGVFDFKIINSETKKPSAVHVSNSQIEIDAAFEGTKSLSLLEAKRDLSKDFLIRQIYYPYRLWKTRVAKPVRTVFLIYSNGIYHLYEYRFQDPENYNSLLLMNHKNYSIENTKIKMADLQLILKNAVIAADPQIPFPQADSFERIINLCELLSDRELSRDEVTEQYAFDIRQTGYYTDAARYLGLIRKGKDRKIPVYELTETGKSILRLNYKQRQLAFCNLILSHKIFNSAFRKYLEKGGMPSKNELIIMMKSSGLYNMHSGITYGRRSSTIKSWLNWMTGLVSDSMF
mgnify:CR=1 FL=1